ncbi:MAG: RNA-binding transcriptional accessory protein [Firmicutes bacterium]|nr:RNA-binding transcriptional accessory protein [Bacillota bacterium]
MDIIKKIAGELNLKPNQVANTIKLLDDGNTVPFIARYRKEMTGELDEGVIREIESRTAYLRNLENRKQEVIRLIDEQGKLTPELVEKINGAVVLQEVEDLYRPYKPKRRTRATIAKEKGLEPLAETLLAQDVMEGDITQLAVPFVDEEKGVASPEEALQGAVDIIAEWISDNAEFRKVIRDLTVNEGILISKGEQGTKSEYEMYYDYKERVKTIPPYRVLAVNRGEREGFLSVKIEAPDKKILTYLNSEVVKQEESITAPLVFQAVEDAYKRLIAPSIEREVRNGLTSTAEDHAIKVFSENLRNLLLQPPIKGRVVLGIDPAYRTGCKIAVVDETGKLLETGVIYPTPPQNEIEKSKEVILDLVRKHGVSLISIGNGTASRETELFVAQLISESGQNIHYIVVSEAGASVYSASEVAREEFPDLDVSVRGAISIARRVQDPLAELVKIEPKSIGVGQYQHDVNQKKLAESLAAVVESCVNSVGVDLNTASFSLLKYVAGVSSRVAKNIVNYRNERGAFKSREELKQVPHLGEQTFIQCAGFLRIPGAENPLDNTPVHPESYSLAEGILSEIGFALGDLKDGRWAKVREALKGIDVEDIAERLGGGIPTIRDIIEALMKPGRDPREDMPQPIFKKDVLKMEDLKPDMVLTGTVRNVVDFGAFVDIGVGQDGLVHISELSDKFVKRPMDVVAVGDLVRVRVLSVDVERERISLSMRGV